MPFDEFQEEARAPRTSWGLRALVLILVLSMVGCVSSAEQAELDAGISIPAQSDWTDYGQIIQNGTLGEWDYQLFGSLTGAAVKKDGTYYLYHQGASGYRTVDDTVTWRAIGVATSPDGINFTKCEENPVITWFPSDNGEEGATSAAVTLDDSGEIVLYYGANTAQSATQVNADARLATSPDGVSFTDQGIVLDHRDGSIWGFGDELFPIIVLHDAERWAVYYLPNGSPQSRKLGVAWGNDRSDLPRSSGVSSGFSNIHVWGMGGGAEISTGTYALFLKEGTNITVRIVSLSAPNRLSAPVETYQFDKVSHATVLLDEEANTWFMYYRGASKTEYGVKLAPAGELDATPPTAPETVTATPVSDREVDLSWSPATDPDTGIVLYEVFRDGDHLATVKGWSFTDTGLVEQTEYSYAVSAISYHGIKGPQSVPITATTSVDVTPPRVVSVNASGSPREVTMVFDEPVEGTSAEMPANYAIDQGISVTGATLHPDLRTVVLTTSAQRHCTTYRVTVNNVRDRAQVPNVVAPDTAVRYTYSSVRGLVGAWMFDEGEGETAFDTANYGNDGALIYTDKSGPAWTAGKYGNGLQFDGIDDQVTIDGAGSLEDVTDQSYTFAAWARPDSLPPNSTPNDPFYSVVVRNYTGLYYDHDGRFRALSRLADDTEVAVSSEALDPGAWHHLAMVVDDMNKQLRLYVDGQEVHDSPVSYTGALADHEDSSYYIGTSEPLTERYEYRFKGKIDEPRIFDRDLSPSEVQVLFARSSGNPVCSLLWLPFVTICRDNSL